jgi:uncharacterized protein (DUF433 family)
MKVNGWDDEPTRPTIRGDVIDTLRRIKGGTMAQIAEHLPQWSHKQVKTALSQAVNKGLIARVGGHPVRERGKIVPAIYGAPPEAPPAPLWDVRPPNSVFELGTRAQEYEIPTLSDVWNGAATLAAIE